MFAMLLLTVGCKGPAGSDGKQGAQGIPGLPSGHFEFITGPVSNDGFAVTDNRIGQSQQTTVYLSDGTNYTALNAYLPSHGVNAYYLVSGNQVQIINAKTAGGVTYLIDVYLAS